MPQLKFYKYSDEASTNAVPWAETRTIHKEHAMLPILKSFAFKVSMRNDKEKRLSGQKAVAVQSMGHICLSIKHLLCKAGMTVSRM